MKKTVRKKAGKGLGEARWQILLFIHRFKAAHDYSPSIREIGKGIGSGLKKSYETSTSVISYHLRRLEQEGLLASHRYQSRTAHLTTRGKALIQSALEKEAQPYYRRRSVYGYGISPKLQG